MLLEALRSIDFSRRYYSYCDAHGSAKSGWQPDRDELESALAELPLKFVYHAKERFFQHDETIAAGELSLRIAVPAGLEMLLYLKTNHGYIGGPYAMLARQVAQLGDPRFSHVPPYPKLPASDGASLREGISFGASLFDLAKQAIVSTWSPPTSATPTMKELPGLIDKGLAMVEERLRASNGARIFDSIKAQLTYMKQTVEAHEKPADDKLDKLLLGVYAAREFETSDPDFADVLFNVEYLFKRL